MMFSNKFIVSVKANGRILRESSNLITLPFGAEYEILLKNLNSRRAMVRVAVDGQDATEGTRLIIEPNASVVLERFIRDGNMQSGNRFKFIERTSGIESHRGIKEDDGLIRAEFWAEQEKPKEIIETIIRRQYDDQTYPQYPVPRYPRWGAPPYGRPGFSSTPSGPRPMHATRSRGPLRGPSASIGKMGSIQAKAMRSIEGSSRSRKISGFVEQERGLNEAGITVPGSESNQQFYSAAGFPLETQSTVIVLQLRGEAGGVKATAPITVKSKPTCSTCGKVNKALSKFCADCGTALILI